MHPILADREKLFVYLAAWLVIAILIAALVAIPGDLGWSFALAFAIPASLVYAFICLSAWWLCRVYLLQKTNVLKLLGVYAVSASLSSSLWILLCNAWVWALNQSQILGFSGERTVGETRLLFGIGVVLYLLAVAVHYLIIAFEASREAERRTLDMRVLAQEAELRALRAQIDPHFLFNSLNSISALTAQDPTAARTMTVLLSDFFRSAHLVDGGTVSLRTRRENGFLTIEVMNPIDPDRPKALGTGVGMENVRRRLRTLFDSAARVDTSTKNGMFSVEISFPANDSMQP